MALLFLLDVKCPWPWLMREIGKEAGEYLSETAGAGFVGLKSLRLRRWEEQ
jgi:hypothetical protein